MTQQFKFGDRVRCKQTGAEGLIIDTGIASAWIIWEGQKCLNFYAYGTFEAIPPPRYIALGLVGKSRPPPPFKMVHRRT